ncbi:hypothetical protein C0J52_09054 [Blattella germanica]|nr:hypothetical protein C0J52_09054 [Blattella germanica]
MYKTEFIPVIDPGDPYPTQYFQISEEVRSEPHYLRSYSFCWCDYDSLGQFRNGIVPMAFVVEITVHPVDRTDPRVRALIGTKTPTLPVFQCEDGQVYFRKYSTIVKYSMTDIAEQAKEEMSLIQFPNMMKAWKRWKTITMLLELLKKAESWEKKEDKSQTDQE